MGFALHYREFHWAGTVQRFPEKIGISTALRHAEFRVVTLILFHIKLSETINQTGNGGKP
jgi:hypothetical protein